MRPKVDMKVPTYACKLSLYHSKTMPYSENLRESSEMWQYSVTDKSNERDYIRVNMENFES